MKKKKKRRWIHTLYELHEEAVRDTNGKVVIPADTYTVKTNQKEK